MNYALQKASNGDTVQRLAKLSKGISATVLKKLSQCLCFGNINLAQKRVYYIIFLNNICYIMLSLDF